MNIGPRNILSEDSTLILWEREINGTTYRFMEIRGVSLPVHVYKFDQDGILRFVRFFQAPMERVERPIMVGEVRKFLLHAGYTEATMDDEETPGFVVFEKDGAVRVEYTFRGAALGMGEVEHRNRLNVRLLDMERALSRHGFVVSLFVPDEGTRFFEIKVLCRV